jgi:hypothetical protein
MNKYELTNETKVKYGVKLYRIKALKDFSDVSKGDLGGWIEKESNLSQSGDAVVYGDAWVSGNAKATKKVINLIANTWNITLTDNHIQIGCKQFTFEKFIKLHKNFSKVKSQFYENDLEKILPYRKVLVELVKIASGGQDDK